MKNIVRLFSFLVILVLLPLKFYGQNEIMLEPKLSVSKSVSSKIEVISTVNTKISYVRNNSFEFNNIFKTEWHLFGWYKLSVNQKTGLGYALVRKNPFEDNFENEHRISESYLIKRVVGKWAISNNFIVEQRIFSSKYYNRFRNNFIITFPAIFGRFKTIKKRDLSNELLCNTSNITRPTYDYRLTLTNSISLPQKQGLKIAVQYRIEHLENEAIQKHILYLITSFNFNL